MNPISNTYIELLGQDEKARLALLACSAALHLDDKIAREAINLVAESNGSTDSLLRRIKNLSCVWKQWDGSWYIAEDVRRDLLDHLYKTVPEVVQLQLRERLVEYADQKAKSFSADGQITEYRTRQAKFEAAYQRTLIPEQSESGAAQFAEVWRESRRPAADAIAQSVDYLAPELSHYTRHVPAEILFLQGMAARARKDKENQQKYFGAVWKMGQPGYIYAVAAHLFGLLVTDRNIAERALRDSIQWDETAQGKAIKYHSLGNLLSKNRRRWSEAEEAYRESFKLDEDPYIQAETWHSLGNLLSKDPRRWSEAERAYRLSIKLRTDSHHRGQAHHSLGNLLSKQRRQREAEESYKLSLRFSDSAEDRIKRWHSLANLLAKDRQRWHEAEEAYRESLKLDKNPHSKAETLHSLANLLAKDRNRWSEAEDAYKQSLELLKDPHSRAQVMASWANLLSKSGTIEGCNKAEKLALESLSLDPDDLWTNAVCYRVLADIHEFRGDLSKAIEALEKTLELDRRQGKKEFVRKDQERIAALHRRLKGR